MEILCKAHGDFGDIATIKIKKRISNGMFTVLRNMLEAKLLTSHAKFSDTSANLIISSTRWEEGLRYAKLLPNGNQQQEAIKTISKIINEPYHFKVEQGHLYLPILAEIHDEALESASKKITSPSDYLPQINTLYDMYAFCLFIGNADMEKFPSPSEYVNTIQIGKAIVKTKAIKDIPLAAHAFLAMTNRDIDKYTKLEEEEAITRQFNNHQGFIPFNNLI